MSSLDSGSLARPDRLLVFDGTSVAESVSLAIIVGTQGGWEVRRRG